MSGSADVYLHLWLVVSGSPDVCLQLSQVICLPVWLVVSGSPDVCLDLSLNSFVSQSSGWWCLALRMSVFTCLPSFVSQSGWWCPALRMSLLTWFCSFVARFPDVSLYLSTCKCLPEWRVLSGTPRISFSLSRSLSLSICFPLLSLFPKQFIVGVLHSFLRRVLLFAGGGVRLS